MTALGHHEVIIESPHHDEHPHTASSSQHVLVIEAYIDRLKEFSRKQYVRYASIIRNHKREACASISHPHSQIIAVPTIPRTIDEELNASREFWRKTGSCIYCSILKKEQNDRRSIWQNNDFMVVSPWAAVHPYEFWILPKRHSLTLLEISEAEKQSLSKAIRTALGGLNRCLGDPPYNLGFHIMPKGFKDDMGYYHWHLEVYPQLAAWGGFEKSTGMFINTVASEYVAADLREAM